ncbi:hypothetical protein HKCCE3408_10560 [Rhodobacterales bacterium HKCCE3408]|nr:hypothetical protein [Rhodobacterales bacterium HKCCE3408]
MDYDQEFRKRFAITDRFCANLRDIWQIVEPHLPMMLADFYREVEGDPDMSAHFRDRAHMMSAKEKQIHHWKLLFTDGFGEAYNASARTVGEVHYRIGLPNMQFMAMYTMAARMLMRKVAKGSLFKRPRPELAESLAAAIMIDCEAVSCSFQRCSNTDRENSLQEVGDVLQLLATGVLDRRIEKPFAQRFENVRHALNGMADKFSTVFKGVSENATTVKQMTRDVSSMADDLSERAQGQAAAVEESNAAVTELSNSVRDNNAVFDRAIKASAGNRSAAEEGLDAAGRANEAMERIRAGFQDITRITGDIEEISFQTNLLALNASVEAARAGEAGKGFAVVATEVSSLAKRAAELTDNIRRMVDGSSATVDQGSDLFGKTRETLEKIRDSAEAVSSEIQTAVSAAQEQSMTIDEVKRALDSIDTVTQKNAAIAAQVAENCEGLEQSADGLSRPFDIFRETGGSAPAPSRAA